ncbi:MAG: leucine-rich repeat protein [Alistipes sp.]|nr:leucine-rich repeat protein [Alistipes sp.]
MKKILFVALAAVGLAACVQNEELAVSQDGKAITFDNAYVENATKAAIDGSYTAAKGNLDHFNVWATIGNNGASTNIFEELLVEKTNGAWTYDASYTQYWIPGNHYEFVGVVDGNVSVTNDACKMPITIATNLSEQKDVLYATESRTYNGGEVQPVHLQFEHLLAKAKFTVNNTISAELSDLEYVVESITILNADDQALYTIENGTWEALTQYSEPLDFGVVTKNSAETGAVADRIGYNGSAESNWERLILPQEGKSFSIKVDYKLYKDDVVVYTNIGKENNVMTSGPVDIAAGTAYNFVLTLGNPGEPITFTAGVTDWIKENAPVYYDVVEVATVEQFETAFATSDVNTIVLGEDVVLGASATRAESDPKLTITNGKSLTIDLNGHKLSATSSLSTSNRELFLVKGNLTIKNGTIEYQHVGENMGWNAMTTIFDVTAGGVLNLEGVTATNLGGSDMGFVAHLNNWGEVTLNVENSTLQSNYVAVRVFNSGPNKNNVDIKNSILKGGSTALWVHNYTAEDFGSESKAAAQQALLNLNYLDQGNTFRPHANSVRYGFTNSIRFNLEGITKSVSEDGTEVTLGSLVEDGVVGRYVAGDEENSTIKKVVVSEGIATLYDRTFRRFFALEEVVLPSTLTTIGAEGTGVFQTCTSLKSIVLPENLTVLGNGTFYGCSSLESVNIPAGVTRIEENCLRETALEEIVFHEGVTYFGAQAFRDCKKLKKVVINAPEFTVAANAFGVMAGTLPGTTIYVANEEMKAYLESTLAYKNQFTIVGPQLVSTTADLQAALDEGKNVVLANNLTITPAEMSTAPYGNKMALSQKGGVFNGNGKAISVTADGDNYVLMTNGGTIKNLDIDRGFRGVVLMSPTQDVYVDNVKVGVNDEVCYTINTAEGDGTHSLYVSNSVLNGWCSIGTAVKDVTFTNCTFGQGTYYTNVYGRLVKPYVNAVFDGCDFCNKCYLDLSAFEGTKVIVKNCTVNGVKITAENWASLVAPEATCEDGQISVELKNGSYLTAENVVDYIVFE